MAEVFGNPLSDPSTIARGFSDKFTGINSAAFAAFVAVQLIAVVRAMFFSHWLLGDEAAAA